jgi:1-acyl-sn-glycerol-3-phosphate acyltransferase
VRPVAIDYGEAARDIGWYQEPGKANVFRTLGRRRSLPITIRILDPLPPMDDRKALAHSAREAIEAALASSRDSARV